MPSKYTPRLSVDLTQQQFDDLQLLMDHGLRKIIFGVIVDDVIRLMKANKAVFVGAILKRRFKLEDILEMEMEQDGNNS